MYFNCKSLFTLIFIISCFLSKPAKAQTVDVSWVSAKLNTKLHEKWSMAFQPIQRTQLNTGEYLNTSLDISASRKLTKQWTAQLLVRHFLVPNAPKDRTLFWTSLIHTIKLNPIIFKNIFRHHWGLNVHQQESDFFRWIPQIAYQFSPKVTLFVQSDVFFRLNTVNGIRQVRYQGGINSKISKKAALNFQYWRQNSVKTEPERNTNIYMFNFIYSIARK